MNEETLNTFDLTPAEMATFTALQEYTRNEDQQQQNQHSSLQPDPSQIQQDIPSTPSYFDLDLDIDPRLLTPTPAAISTPSHGTGSPAPFDASNTFSSPLYTYPDPTTAATTSTNTSANAGLDINNNNNNLFNRPQPPYHQQSPHRQLPASISNSYNLPPTQDDNNHAFERGGGINHNMRHQLLGHRRSVSVPPEEHVSFSGNNFEGGGGGVMTFSRGGTPLGENMVSNKRGHPRGLAGGHGVRSGERHGGGHGKNGRVLLKNMARKRLFERSEEDAATAADVGSGGHYTSGDENGRGGGGGGMKRGRYELRSSHTFGPGGSGTGGDGMRMGMPGRNDPTSAPCSSPAMGGMVWTRGEGGRGYGGGGRAVYYPPEMCADEPLPPSQPPSTPAPVHTWSQSRSPVPGCRLQHPQMDGTMTAGGSEMMRLQNSLSVKEAEKRWFERADVQELVAMSGHGGANTAQLVALAKLESLARDIDGVKDMLQKAFCEEIEHGREEKEGDHIEKYWSEKRRMNGDKTSLDDPLEVLPFSAHITETTSIDPSIDAKGDIAAVEHWLPRTGQALKDIDGKRVNDMLALYELPVLGNMFVCEKKLLLLRFLGVGRELIGKIID